MATRIDRTPNLSNRFTDRLLVDYLRSQAGKKETDTRFLGLKRSNALSDINDNFITLNNLLRKINVLDVADKTLYGRDYNADDWSITRNFLDEGINSSFLSPLSGLGGSTTPRIRIEDRLSFVDSFYGKGSIQGLHSGPDAQFYIDRGSAGIGSIRFTFDAGTGIVTVAALLGPDGVTPITASDILGVRDVVVIDLDSYTVTGGQELSISGSGVSLRLTSPGSWSVDSGLGNLLTIRQITGVGDFVNSVFGMSRPASVINKPKWFTDNPGSAGVTGPGGADDSVPATSSRLLTSKSGQILPVTEFSYWYTKAYVESRWIPYTDARLYISNPENSIVQDSNMRWRENPSQLRGEQYNWGIRWDGYLLITPASYVFTVQTNVDIRIDLDVAGDSANWLNVFDTRTAVLRDQSDSYVSASSFNTSALAAKYKYFTGTGINEWVGYVPITIRLFRGGPDKADGTVSIPTEPNMFINTLVVSGTKIYYGQDIDVALSGTDGAWSVSSAQLSELIAILQDVNASVTYTLVQFNGGSLVPATPIVLATDGTVVTSITTGLVTGSYVLRVAPSVPESPTPLWRGRIAAPGPEHKDYSDLANDPYVPDLRRAPFSARPEWWKIFDGSPYVIGQSPSSENTPIDGFVRSGFRDILNSEASGVGLYGDGSGVFSLRPNIILGESRYNTSEPLSSNYIGFLLKPNRLGEGGKLIVNALPVNNSTGSDATLLGANDLGGSPNHLTLAAANLTARSAQLHLWTNDTLPDPALYNKYYTVADLTTVAASNDPTLYGLPPFSDAAWLAPVTITCTRVADDSGFTTGVVGFVAPLTLSVERVVVSGFDLLAFTTTLASVLIGGAEVASFTAKFVEFYTGADLAFQYARVDTGEGVSFGDVLKFTYSTGTLLPDLSEVPKPPADRVTPFGFDRPEFSNGLCYPPYTINNPLLGGVVQSDIELETTPVGNYDVIWGNPGQSALGGHTLRIAEKLEFSGLDAIAVISSPVTLSLTSYSHRFRIDTSLDPSLDEDVLEYIVSGEKVKDSYYAFVNLNS